MRSLGKGSPLNGSGFVKRMTEVHGQKRNENEGRKVRGSKAVDGFEDQIKEFELDAGLQQQPVENGITWSEWQER